MPNDNLVFYLTRFAPLTALIKINYSPDPEFRFTITYVDKKEGEVSKQVIAKDATYFTNQDRLRTLIAHIHLSFHHELQTKIIKLLWKTYTRLKT